MGKESVSRKKIIFSWALISILVIALLVGCCGGRTAQSDSAAMQGQSESVSAEEQTDVNGSFATEDAENGLSTENAASGNTSGSDAASTGQSTSGGETTGSGKDAAASGQEASEKDAADQTGAKASGENDNPDGTADRQDEEQNANQKNPDGTASGQQETSKKTCKLTINNGAASANTKEAVNAVHVYDPNTKDLEDFYSGQEVPVGTTISIFVYNLATPVSLHIEHNGTVIADRTYSTLTAWEDDDKVEFFEFTLEGDLLVETKALSSSTKAESVISINNEALGSVKIAKENVYDGSKVRNGNGNIQVSRLDIDVKATVSIDGNNAGSVMLTKNNPSSTFKNLSWNNSKISVEFSPVDKNIEVPKAPEKSTVKIKKGKLAKIYLKSVPLKSGDKIINGTHNFKVVTDKKDVKVTIYVNGKKVATKTVKGGMHSRTIKNISVDGKVVIKLKDVTRKAKKSKYKIELENNVKKADGSMTVGYVNSKEEAVTIVSGKKYKKELMIGARALNYSSKRKLKLIAYGSDGKVIDSVTIKTGTKKNPGANGFYLVLNDDIRYVLKYAGKETEKEKEEETEEETKPDTSEKTFTVEVNNKAAEANTDNAVNGLHVYDQDDPDMEDINGKAKLKKGAKIRIFAYPLASDIHLKIVHDGKILADKDIKKLRGWEDDDKVEFFDLTLKGNLTVITTVKKEPETKEPETKEPESKEPESKEPESKEPATKEPESTEPESKEPESKEPESKEPESTEPESKEPVSKEPETGETKEQETTTS